MKAPISPQREWSQMRLKALIKEHTGGDPSVVHYLKDVLTTLEYVDDETAKIVYKLLMIMKKIDKN